MLDWNKGSWIWTSISVQVFRKKKAYVLEAINWHTQVDWSISKALTQTGSSHLLPAAVKSHIQSVRQTQQWKQQCWMCETTAHCGPIKTAIILGVGRWTPIPDVQLDARILQTNIFKPVFNVAWEYLTRIPAEKRRLLSETYVCSYFFSLTDVVYREIKGGHVCLLHITADQSATTQIHVQTLL